MARSEFKIEGLEEFGRRLVEASEELRKDIALWLEALGFQFLEEVRREIIRTETVDTRRLLNSFNRGEDGNIWRIENGGLSLEIGTNVEYAEYVNDGHFTIDPNKGLDRRWVPGQWVGDRFEYDPNAKTGMLLKLKWIEGSHYWDNAFTIFEKMFQKSLESRLESFLESL